MTTAPNMEAALKQAQRLIDEYPHIVQPDERAVNLARAFLVLHASSQWQPIAEAPRDGVVLLWARNSAGIPYRWGIHLGIFDEYGAKYRDEAGIEYMWETRDDLDDIGFGGESHMVKLELFATYFMPLPTPPSDNVTGEAR